MLAWGRVRRGLEVLVGFVLLATAAAAGAEPTDPLIDVGRGTLPIIISAPHGGSTDVPGVPGRVNVNAERFVTGIDGNTRELAHKLFVEIEKQLGGKPYYVVARFKRRNLDANRTAEHAYEVPEAKFYYETYHRNLADFCREVQNQFGTGLFIDVHGQASFPNDILVGTVGGETVKLLRQRHGDEALVGHSGVVGFLRAAGMTTMPGLDATELNLPQYNGGYTVQTYGSHKAEGIDAVQFEFGSKYRGSDRLNDTAKRTAAAIARFYETYLPKKRQTAANEPATAK